MATSQAVASSVESCPECSGTVRTTNHETVCVECGLLIDDSPVDHGPEWRSYNHSEERKKRRTGSPRNANLKGNNLGSEVGFKNERRGKDHKLSTWNTRSKTPSKKDRGKNYATTEIHRICHCLELPEYILIQAKKLFRQAHENDLSNGRRCLDTVAATCIYTTTRINQCGRNPDEILEYASTAEDTTRKDVFRAHSAICAKLGLQVPPPSIASRVIVVGEQSDVGPKTIRKAEQMVSDLDDMDTVGASPSAVAAAAIYMASGGIKGPFTQDDIAKAAGCNAVSLRKYNTLFE